MLPPSPVHLRDLLALCLVLAACGGDGGTTTTGSTGADTGPGPTTTAAPTSDTPATGTPTTGTPTTDATAATSTGSDTTTIATSEATSTGGATEPAPGTTTGAVQTTGGDTGGSSSTGADVPDLVPVLPSAGCGLGGAKTGLITGLKIPVDGVDRLYNMFVPKPYDADRPHPVIFSYHGVGGTANTNQFKLDNLSTANDGYSINVAPQGWTSPEWNEIHFVPYNLDASLVVFDQVLAKLSAEYCIDLNRIYVTGHSNGGQMAFHLGCLRADRVRAVFPSGGRCFSYGPGVCDPYNDLAHQCNGEVMVMSVMGELDVERHADEEATLAGFTARQGCTGVKEAVDPSPCLRFTGCDPGKEVTTCRIPGLAHQLWKDGFDDVYAVMMSL